jgi:hypothetical protein
MKAGCILVATVLAPVCGATYLPTADERPSILLISLDTLRADHLGTYGYPRATSPFIDSLSKKGLVFENAMTVSKRLTTPHTSQP